MTQRAATHPRADLRAHPTSGLRLVARDLDDPSLAWHWFRGARGWEDREPWPVARVDDLESLPALEGFASGWPGAQPPAAAPASQRLPPPPRGPARDAVLRSKVTVDEANRLIIAATTAGETLSSWIRRVCLAELDK